MALVLAAMPFFGNKPGHPPTASPPSVRLGAADRHRCVTIWARLGGATRHPSARRPGALVLLHPAVFAPTRAHRHRTSALSVSVSRRDHHHGLIGAKL